ncbi:unnamed protein product [Ixodes persulcatus]
MAAKEVGVAQLNEASRWGSLGEEAGCVGGEGLPCGLLSLSSLLWGQVSCLLSLFLVFWRCPLGGENGVCRVNGSGRMTPSGEEKLFFFFSPFRSVWCGAS